MKRIYVILPKKLDTNPPIKVGCGFGMAQVHHATVLACKRFKLSEEVAVVILQVPDTKALKKLYEKIAAKHIRISVYWEKSNLFKGEAITALVTSVQPRKMKIFSKLKLWGCDVK